MNKRRLFKAAACAAAFAPLFFASCVDDSYDLSKDIDMTVTIGGNLSIPGSGTEEFSLDDIMDLEYKENPEDSVIRTDADGNYRLLKEESSDPTDVDIEPVIIDEPECEETITTLNFDTPAAESGEVEAQVEDVEMNFTFTKDDVTTDVTEVSAADVDFKAYLTLSFEPISHNVDEITLKSGFTIEMQMEGQTQADNMVYELTDLDNYRVKDGAPQTIEFINDQTIRAGESLRVPVRFLRIQNFPDGQGLYALGHFRMRTHVIANGTATTTDLNEGNIQVNLFNNAEVPAITLEQVEGKFDPEVDITIDPVTVNDVPDFLNDNENNLDLKNPYIKLTMSNGTPIDVNLTADIIRMKDGVQDDAPIRLGSTTADRDSIILYAAKGDAPTVSTYYLSREAMPEVAQEGNHTYNIVMGEDIYRLVRTIPDEIRLENIEAKALDQTYTVPLGQDGAHYVVNTDYQINAPLQFGQDLLITYKDTIDDWHSDMEDITISKAVVEMDAINGIPLNFSVDAQAIDVNGNVYPNVTVTPVQGTIAPGLKLLNGDASAASENKLILEITCESGDMKDLDGLIISFNADKKNMDGRPELQNATLNKGMTLQLKNIRVRIENGVTVDMN